MGVVSDVGTRWTRREFLSFFLSEDYSSQFLWCRLSARTAFRKRSAYAASGEVGEDTTASWTALEEEEDDVEEEVVEDEESTDIDSEGEEPGDVFELF